MTKKFVDMVQYVVKFTRNPVPKFEKTQLCVFCVCSAESF